MLQLQISGAAELCACIIHSVCVWFCLLCHVTHARSGSAYCDIESVPGLLLDCIQSDTADKTLITLYRVDLHYSCCMHV